MKTAKGFYLAMTLLMLAAIVLPAGCSKEDGTRVPESNRWLELLSVLPANDNTLRSAYLQDLAYLEKKRDSTSSLRYPLARNLPLFGSSPNAYSDEEWKQTLGFTQADVIQTIFAGAPPMSYYEAIHGRFSREDVDNAARTGPGNEMMEVVEYHGRQFYSWGTDNDINMSLRSNVRPLGRGHRLALVDDFILWVRWTDGIKEMIDSHEGNIESLADIEDYRLLSEALAGMDTVTAFFSNESQSQSRVADIYRQVIDDPDNNERRQLLVDGIQSDDLLKPYQALATGAGIDERGYYLAIVLLIPSAEVAQDNAALLESRLGQAWNVESASPWTDIVVSMEIESQGRLTLAKLYGEASAYWDNFDLGTGHYEPLLVHE